MKLCLDLFAGLGGFSAAFKESDDWEVVTVDVNPEFDPDICADVMDLRPSDILDAIGLDRDDIDVLVILSSPPCEDFSLACAVQKWDIDGARLPKYVPKWESIADSIALVFKTMWLIHELQPRYWYLENPSTGLLKQFIGRPAGAVHYCQYGGEFKKPTGLWGVHAPMHYRTCPGPDRCDHVHNPRESNAFRDGTSEAARLGDVELPAERAKVPYDLSESILEAVEKGYKNPPPEQARLPLATTDGRFTVDAELGGGSDE